MLLKDILARELKAWPHAGNALGQAGDGTLHLNECAEHGGKYYGWTKEKFTEAEDWKTAWITRAEWQAAVEALKAEQAAELKWPDGAEFKGEGSGHFYRNVTSGSFEVWIRSRSCWETVPGVPSYQPLIPRPTERAVEWDGVGDPPKGTAVEVRFAFEKFGSEWPWHAGVVVISGKQPEGGEILVVEADGFTVALRNTAEYIRPASTQEQIAAEEREKAIIAIRDDLDVPTAIAERAYDKGYRKQVAE